MASNAASTTINIHQVHGSEPTGHLWGSIQVLNSEWKNSNGTPWTEPLPGKKKNKWVDVQTILRKLAEFEKPAYLIFCRTNESFSDDNYGKRKSGDPYKIMTPIPFVDGKQYFYLETHGKHRAIDFDALPEYYRQPHTFYFRAPPGKKCSQYGPAYGYIPYDYAMSCFMSGVENDTTPTNDLLQLNDMNIMLRDYSDEHCDISFLERSNTSRKTFRIEGIGSKGRKYAIPKMNGLSPIIEQKEHTSPDGEGPSKKIKVGGTVKRKRRKRKTRKR